MASETSWPLTLIAKLKERILDHPLTRGLDADDPRTTDLRQQIILSKPFLRAIYHEWYSKLSRALPPIEGSVLELGSGAGFCEQFIPNLIKSELLECHGVNVIADGQRLPFADSTLRAISFVNVFHHLPRVRDFLSEAERCLKPGGRILMVEPWVTAWSTMVNTRLHHEPFLPRAEKWEFEGRGPLTGANGALPWIVFHRDREIFEREYPQFIVERIEPFMPIRYLVSGGVTMRSLMPGFTHRFWVALENSSDRLRRGLAMFAFVAITKRTVRSS
jgi:SAM-dependent methyltransferase